MRIETLFYLKTVNALSNLDLKSIDVEGKKINSITIHVLSSTFTIHLDNYFSENFKKLKNDENDSETEMSLQVGEKFVLHAGDGYYQFTSFADFKIDNTGSSSGIVLFLINEVR